MAIFNSVSEQVDFYRSSVALFAFGVALLSGVFPVLLKETSKKHLYSAQMCFAGSYYFTLAYLRNFHKENTDTETVCVVVGCLTAMLCKIILVPNGTHVDLPTFDEVGDNQEIEMMLPSKTTSTEYDDNDVRDMGGPSDTSHHRVVIPNHENRCIVMMCFVASFLFNVGDGIDFASKEHIGYGKLFATVSNAALISGAQGTLLTRNLSLYAYYGSLISILSLSYPIGIVFGIFSPAMLDGLIAAIVIAFSRGVLLSTSLVCLVSSPFQSGGKPARAIHVVAILVGSTAAIMSCVYF